jgi:hypothetical protein
MARFNSSSVSKIESTRGSVAWGKKNFEQNSTLVFAALLIVCALAVGCSNEKPKTENSGSTTPVAQVTPPASITPASAPVTPAEPMPAKPAHKKLVRKIPPTVTFADKSSGVTFQYPRKFALKSGDSASQLVSESSAPMSFVQPGGVAVVAVAIPEGAYPKSDLASAFFDVSVNKSLTEEQCGAFSGTQAGSAMPVDGATPTTPATPVTASPATPTSAATTTAPASKLIIGDMELLSSDTTASVGTRKETAKYYHVFENGVCYEFALKVATTGVETDEGGKHVDRDEIFKRLGKILATVKVNPVKSPEVAASVAAAPAPSVAETPTK